MKKKNLKNKRIALKWEKNLYLKGFFFHFKIILLDSKGKFECTKGANRRLTSI
jgi:hypothetical protein